MRRSSPCTASTRLWASIVALVVLASACSNGNDESGETARTDQPDIILINIDDADLDLIGADAVEKYFPNIDRHLQQNGLRLDNLHVADPLCGPSRASLFRGQYPHNTGIELNHEGDGAGGPDGSWAEFLSRGYVEDELGVWMQRANYQTALVGKYHHTQFPFAAGNAAYVPPGWHDFRASNGNRYQQVTRFVNGERVLTERGDYRTDLERDDAIEILEDRDPSKPLFLYLAPFAPHGSPDELYAPRHAELFPDAIVPRTPDLNEADFSDKPAIYASLPRLSAETMQWEDENFRDRLRSMMAVDEMVGEIFATLDRLGTTDNTFVFFTSDNGYQLGHHRLHAKKDPFDRTTRVGLLAAGPGIDPGTSEALLVHIDITATILELGGADIPPSVDGRSFVPLLRGEPLPDRPDGILIENREPKTVSDVQLDLDYVALRFDEVVYVEYAGGDREYYDLDDDPFQLENRYDDLTASERAALEERLDRLRSCTGAACRGGRAPDPIATQIDEAVFSDGTLVLRGSTSASRPIDRVELTIRSASDNRYWDGQDLVEAPSVVEHSTAASGSWIYEVALPADDYWVAARAVDTAGERDPEIEAIWVRGRAPLPAAPEAKISTPPGLVTDAGPIVFEGVVVPVDSADAPRVRVRLTRTDLDFASYFDGTAWVDEPNTWLDAKMDGLDWSFSVSLESATYQVQAYALDDGGRLQTWGHGRPSIDVTVR